MEKLAALAKEAELVDKFQELYNGAVINTGENRLVLHQMTRGQLGEPVKADGVDKRTFYVEQQNRIAEFANKVHAGEITNAAGEKFTTVVQIGIGGSDLGPRAMEKAIQIYCDQEDHEIIELRNHGKMMYIRQADIIYAERQDRIVQIHTAQGTYQCYQSLTKIMKLLGRNFLRCHGGYVVNYNYIDTVMRESVILSNGTEIPIGRTYRTSFHEQYMRMVEQHV